MQQDVDGLKGWVMSWLDEKEEVVENEIVTNQQSIEQASRVEIEKEVLQVAAPCLQVKEDPG